MADNTHIPTLSPGIIEDIAFHHARKAIPRTTVFLSREATRESVSSLAQMLVAQGLQIRPSLVEGKWALKIHSPVAGETDFLAALKQAGAIDDHFIAGWEARQKQKELDDAPKGAFKKAIAKIAGTKEQRLQRAGISYAVGDWIGMGIGLNNKSYGDFAFGLFAHLGTLPWIFYSRDKTGRSMGEKIVDDMRDDFTRHGKASYAVGIATPPQADAKESFDRYMYRNAYYVGAVFNLISSPPLAKAGLTQGNPSKFVSGVLNTSGWVVNLFVTPEGEKGAINWGKTADALGIGTEYRALKREAINKGEPVPEKKHSVLTAPFRALGQSLHTHTHQWGSVLMLVHNFNMLFLSTFKDIFYGQAEKHDIARRYDVPIAPGKPERFREKLFAGLRKLGFKSAEVPDPHGEWKYALDKGKRKITNTPLANPERFNLPDGTHWTTLKRGSFIGDGPLDTHITQIKEDARHGRSNITFHEAEIFEQDALRYDEKRRLKVSGWLTAGMIGAYMLGGALIGSVGGANKKLNLDEVYSDAALLLLQQKEPVHQIALLADMTEYFSRRPEFESRRMSQEQIVRGIMGAAKTLAESPLLSEPDHAHANEVIQGLGKKGLEMEAAQDKKPLWSAKQPPPAAQWGEQTAAIPTLSPSR